MTLTEGLQNIAPYSTRLVSLVCLMRICKDSSTDKCNTYSTVNNRQVKDRFNLVVTRVSFNPRYTHHKILLDFSLTVKAATLIFISGCGSAISSAKEGKSGLFIIW